MGKHGSWAICRRGFMRVIGSRMFLGGMIAAFGAAGRRTAFAGTGVVEGAENSSAQAEAGKVTAGSNGLHGYIGFSATRPPARSEYIE